MRIMIAGAWDEEREDILQIASDLGSYLASKGVIVITGGGSGTPYAVNSGVHKESGTSIAFINSNRESDSEKETNIIATHKIYTEMGWDGRSVIAVKSADALVVLGGKNGTLNEITLAYLNKIPIFILENSSDLITRFRNFLLEDKYIDVRRNIPIVHFSTIDQLIEQLNVRMVSL